MKVYAHYEEVSIEGEPKPIGFRWNTVLQFGSSWKNIGAVVMKNPGSSAPIKDVIIDEKAMCHLQLIDSKNEWFVFSVDNTMLNIEKLFLTYYHTLDGITGLNGVVRIFNLINVRDADLEKALNKYEKVISFPYSNTVDEDIENLVSPVYLGWGGLGFDAKFKNDAFKIYNAVTKTKKCNYLKSFNENKYYHPQYLMGRGKNMPNSQYLLNAFCQNTVEPVYDKVIIPKLKISKEVICKELFEHLKRSLHITEETPKTCRYELNDDLSLTITMSGKGYVGIRHPEIKGGYISTERSNFTRYLTLLEKYGFSTNSDKWLGVKEFKEYGYDDNEIIAQIKDEIKNIKESK